MGLPSATYLSLAASPCGCGAAADAPALSLRAVMFLKLQPLTHPSRRSDVQRFPLQLCRRAPCL